LRRTKSEIDPEDGPPTVSEFFDDLEDIVENCQELWNQLDDLDANTWVLLQDATNKNRASCQRRICLRAPQQDRQQRIDDDTEGESNMEQPTTIVLSLHPGCARQRPENIHILGGSLGSRTGRKSEFDEYEWDDRLMVRENLENCFGPGSLAKPKEDDDTSVSSADKKNYICPTIDCGICFLECTTVTGTAASSPCENPKCARPYHTACLYKWLSTKPTSRTSFDYVLGECPYCNDPIAVQQPEEDEDYV
jgi:E3 ubiquitin-protein ligase FANCL